MRKLKVSELGGVVLDYWVAKALGKEAYLRGADCVLAEHKDRKYTPSTDWAQGGPIIESEEIFP